MPHGGALRRSPSHPDAGDERAAHGPPDLPVARPGAPQGGGPPAGAQDLGGGEAPRGLEAEAPQAPPQAKTPAAKTTTPEKEETGREASVTAGPEGEGVLVASATMHAARAMLALMLLGLPGCPDDRQPLDRWDRKDAHRYCARMIARYPTKPWPPCKALHLCANEAVLGPGQKAKLSSMFREIGCAPP